MPPKNGACRFRSIEKGCARRLGLIVKPVMPMDETFRVL